jgi:hypothetical protein
MTNVARIWINYTGTCGSTFQLLFALLSQIFVPIAGGGHATSRVVLFQLMLMPFQMMTR